MVLNNQNYAIHTCIEIIEILCGSTKIAYMKISYYFIVVSKLPLEGYSEKCHGIMFFQRLDEANHILYLTSNFGNNIYIYIHNLNYKNKNHKLLI